MDNIEVEYNQSLKSLKSVLSHVKNPGDFFVSGLEEIPMPRMEVEGAGTLSFPLPDEQIARLVRKAQQAPYGRGEATIVDTSVRNVWQITSAKVKIGGKSWPATFQTILSAVAAGLGCDQKTVSAELYKLLVYQKGGFFLPHRDTEKTAGMFGTLVLTLPSFYEGGELCIRHGNREVTLETKAADPSELSYAAFFADCEHEVLPVRQGSRVCLVYNLIQQPSKKIPKAPEYESQIAEAAAILDQTLNAADAPAKIVWLLDHQYSPSGLSFAALKGADAAKARVLLRAASQAHCAAHLAIVHIGETGIAEPDFGWSPYRYEHDADFTAASVDDGWQYIDEWRDTDNQAVAFGHIPLVDGELLPAGALNGEPPDEKRVTEATGNEGATYERSYHRAAFVLWLQHRTADVLLQAGAVSALPYLKQLPAGPEALRVAEQILQGWNKYALDGPGPPKSPHRIEMIEALAKLNAPALLDRFITERITPAYDGSENPALLSSVSVLGEHRAASVLSALVSARMADHPAACVELLLACPFPAVAEAAVTGLDRIEKSALKLTPESLQNLLLALYQLKKGAFDAAAEKIASRPEIFNPVTLVVPAIERMGVPAKSIRYLWASAAKFLLARSELAPQPPPDWHLEAKLSCKCPDCTELQTFARHPTERVHRFRVKKERRQHLHIMIDKHQFDMTHVTDRAGSPQTLVCTKDRRTFNQRMKQYNDEINAMRALLKLADQSGTDTLSRRMKTAVSLAQ